MVKSLPGGGADWSKKKVKSPLLPGHQAWSENPLARSIISPKRKRGPLTSPFPRAALRAGMRFSDKA